MERRLVLLLPNAVVWDSITEIGHGLPNICVMGRYHFYLKLPFYFRHQTRAAPTIFRLLSFACLRSYPLVSEPSSFVSSQPAASPGRRLSLPYRRRSTADVRVRRTTSGFAIPRLICLDSVRSLDRPAMMQDGP